MYTDHRPLEKLSRVHTHTLHRLQQLMNEYQFVICYKPGKDNVVADFLSRNPITAIDIERVDLQALQEEDPLIKQLLEDMNAKSTSERWKKLRERLVRKNGILFFIKDDRKRAIFAPQHLTKQILEAAHNSLVGGHMGIFK